MGREGPIGGGTSWVPNSSSSLVWIKKQKVEEQKRKGKYISHLQYPGFNMSNHYFILYDQHIGSWRMSSKYKIQKLPFSTPNESGIFSLSIGALIVLCKSLQLKLFEKQNLTFIYFIIFSKKNHIVNM